MALKVLLATVAAAAVAVGLLLPSPHDGQRGQDVAARSQITQIEVAR
jgi:hypothetical protein